MDLRDFKKVTDRISGLWGENAIAKEKSDALWPYCRPLPLGEAVQIIDAIVSDGDKYFTPAVFASRAMASEKERSLKASMATREKVRVEGCPHCQGCGQLVAYRRDDKWCCGMAFRCTFCRAADQIGLAPQIAPWLSEYGAEFELGVNRDRRLQTRGKEITGAAERASAVNMLAGVGNEQRLGN